MTSRLETKQKATSKRSFPASVSSAPLAEVRRGNIVESRHRGHIAIVDGDGGLVASLGNPWVKTYLRSSAKPHQAIPLITSGAADRFRLEPAEIAIACGSHSGEPIHTNAVTSMLAKVGVSESSLKCGIHEPLSKEAAAELRARGRSPEVLHNNCSGKHGAMLALARHLGSDLASYDSIDHPVQKSILEGISRLAEAPVDKIGIGIDGCGVPTFAIPVGAMALMYARILAPSAYVDQETRRAAKRVAAAMASHPEMVGGTKNRLDTDLMRVLGEKLLSKVGAEGVYTACVAPSKNWPRGLGIALKVEDGEDLRARPVIVVECLRQLGVLGDEQLAALAQYSRVAVKNRRGDVVGEVSPSFKLIDSEH